MRHSVAVALVALALITTPSTAHSWVEQMMVISSKGSFVGNPGYARNNTLRTVPGFSDLLMVHILPGQGQPSIEERQAPAASATSPPTGTNTAFSDTMSILPTDPMCKKTQQQIGYQSDGSPRLKAAPGDMVALRYQENGHVTLPQNQPGKPDNRGMVYIYGTTQPSATEKFLDVFKQWTADGTGGDKRGVLLASQPFDDGQCYQVNGGNVSTARQAEFPHTANELMGTSLWCQNDIALPSNIPSGKPYTLYWVWDWPTAPKVDPNLPNGKAEIYTTCMEIDVTGTKASRDLEERQAPAASGANMNMMAVPKYMKELATPSAQPAQPAQPAQAAQAAQATPASSPAASAPAAPAAPATSAPASPESAAGAVLEASDAQAASEFISFLETAVTAKQPGATALLGSGMVTVTVSGPAHTVTVTETPCAASAAMAGQQSIVTKSSTISSTMQTIYAAPNPVQSAAQAPPQSPAASPSTTAQAASQATPAPPAAAKSSAAVLPPPVLKLQAPVTSGSPPPASAAAPAAASSPAASPVSSAPAAGAPPMPPSPAASAQIPGSPTTPTTETPPAGVSSAPVAAATPASTAAGVFPSGAAAPSGGMQYASSLRFTGTASAVSTAPTGSASPAAAPKGCSAKTGCKLKKRSLLLSGHARFH